MKLAVFAASLTAFLSATAYLVGDVDAAQGDRLSVSRENVNVRTGPSTTAEVLLSINAGEEIVEIAEKGEWFFVEFPALNQRGWIYGPLLDPPGTAPASPAPTTAAVEPSEPTPVTPQPAPTEPANNVTISTVPEPVEIPTEAPKAPTSQAAVVAEIPKQLTEVGTGEEPAAVKSFRETVVELNERAVSVAGINLFTDVRSTGGGSVQVLATDTWTSVPEAGQSSYMNALFERWQSMASGLGPLTLQILDPTGNVVMQRSNSS